MKNRIIAALAGIGLIAGAGLVSAAPAQAFSPITYTANCPTNSIGEDGDWQKLTITNNSGSIIAVTAWEDYPNGQVKNLGTTLAANGTYTFNADGDTVQWQLSGSGNVNWSYSASCFY